MSKFKKIVSKIFGIDKPKAPTEDPRLAQARREEQARIDEQKRKDLEEASARRRGLRGVRSLLTGGFTGFQDSNQGGKTNLGN